MEYFLKVVEANTKAEIVSTTSLTALAVSGAMSKEGNTQLRKTLKQIENG